MKALMTEPLRPESLRLEDIGEPPTTDGSLLVDALALGICGTDREIIEGAGGSPPPAHKRLVLGHESLGVVRDAPKGTEVRKGDLVVPFVRMPDPVPCDCCAIGEWDRCRNGLFTEHGIRSRDGFGRERYRVPGDHVLTVDPSLRILGVLIEPASVVAKAWSEIDRFISGVCWTPRRVLVTGAGPVGLLAAMMGVQRGFDISVFDRASEGAKPALVRDLGATYHSPPFESIPVDFDIIIECTGAASIVMAAAAHTANDGIVCLVGIAGRRAPVTADAGAINDALVLGNRAMFGSVNANRRHYERAHESLCAADREWLARLVTRRVPLDRWREAFEKRAGDIKTVIVFDAAAEKLA